MKESSDSLLTDLQLRLFNTTTVQLEEGERKILNIDNLYRPDNTLRRLDYLALIMYWAYCNAKLVDQDLLRRPQSSFKNFSIS